MYKIRDNKWNRRFCKWMASLLMAALVVNQSSALVLAEEITEETGADTVAADEETDNTGVDEETEDLDAGEDEDTDSDADTAPDIAADEETEGTEAGEDENTGEDIDEATDDVSDVEAEDEDNTLPQDDETENVVEEDAVSPAVVGDTFTEGVLRYRIISEDENDLQVEVADVRRGDVSGTLVIPSTASDGIREYSVVGIGDHALDVCMGLESITIPSSVTSIGNHAFWSCSSLESITIPGSVISIGEYAFRECSSLKSAIIAGSIGSHAFWDCSSLESVIIADGVTSIGEHAFWDCSSLESITIPGSVTSIENCAFRDCSSLESVTILNDNISFDGRTFYNCKNLNSFYIAITENFPRTPTIKDWSCFVDCPDDRYLTFLTEDGTEELSDETALAAAVKAYDVADGIMDGKWYGWKLPDAPDIPDVTYYPVTINVQIDDSAWSDCGKTFALSADHNTFITNLTAVPAGTYTIYDTTGAEDSAGYVDTGVPVEIKDSAVDVVVNYYTVTFYDGDTVFGGQIVPKNARVSKPSAAPTKDGHTFYRWATSEDGSTEFDFEKPITEKTDIYASWIADTEELFTITASAGAGGSVSPSEAKVKSGANQRFIITPEAGYRISSVLVDGNEALDSVQAVDYLKSGITDAENNAKYYDFENVTSDHTLAVSFEAIPTGDGDDSGAGGTGGGDTNDNGGTNGDNSDNSGSDNSGSSVPVVGSDTNVISYAGTVGDANTSSASQGREPKTGDTSHMEIYATIAMIAGLSYILLYFADGKSGMTEEEKKEIIAALMNWAKKGSRVRKYAALAVIFLVLVYYHSIGKRTSADWKEVYAN